MENEKQSPKNKWYKKIKKWALIIFGVFIGICILAVIVSQGRPIIEDVPGEVKQAEIGLKGFSVDANETVKIYLNGNFFSEVNADERGKFNFSILLSEGINTVYAEAIHKDKIKKSSEKEITYINQEKIDAQNKAEEEARAIEQEAQRKIEEEAKLVSQQKAEEEAKELAQKKVDEDVKRLEAKKKAEEEKKIKEAEEQKEEEARLINEEKDYKASCTSISYNKLEKSPYSFVGEKVYYKGKIEQAGSQIFSEWFRVSITAMGYGYYSDTIWVDYDDVTEFVTDDIVRFWGESTGQHCYKSQMGLDICIPSVEAKYISK